MRATEENKKTKMKRRSNPSAREPINSDDHGKND